MSAIKFSKQFIEPNPQEVDYWVDISTNPYGGVIKYYNGETWTVLTSPDGTPINMDAFYNKLQINQMLATKASVESVESKVDDTELSDLMNNIEFKGKDGNGVDMIIFKYDGTNVGITLPTASNTTAGIITKDQFKYLVKLNQLQSLYSEMYSKVTEIYLKFQKKLKAGKNIRIDETTNTIHATGKISTDWNDLTNVPDIDGAIQAEADRAKAEEAKLSARITDHVEVVEGKLDLKADKSDIYTKDQVDEKVASVYKIIGSSAFEELPTEGNTIGDVYNITNDFTLNDIEYPFGTNIVWTADGWDTLSGVFDTTELEGLVEGVDTKIDEEIVRAKAKELELDEKFDGYLPLRGGLLTNELTGLFINRTANYLTAHITFLVNGVSVGDIGVSYSGNPVSYDYSTKKWNNLLHSDNYSNYALPLSGGTITEGLLTIKRQPAMIRYTNYADQTLGYIGFGDDANKPRFTMSDGVTNHMLWHEGNDGEGSGLDADMLDGVHVTNSIHKEGVMRSYGTGTFTTANQYFGNGVIVCFDPKPTDNDDLFENTALLSIGDSANRYRQLAFGWKNYDIKYRYTHSSGGAVIFNNWKTIAFTDSDITGNAATATNADQLDGYDASAFYNLYGGKKLFPTENNTIDLNDLTQYDTYCVTQYASAAYVLNLPFQTSFVLIVLSDTGESTGKYIKQILFVGQTDKQYTRRYSYETNKWTDWVLTLDNLNTYNAPTATKLATPVKLWGNSFDGSSDINNTINFATANNNPTIKFTNGEYIDGFGNVQIKNNSLWRMDTNSGLRLISVKGTGNVGIGTTDPLYMLDVNGQGRFTSNVVSNSDFVSIKLGGYWLFGSGTGDSSSDFIIAKHIDSASIQRTFRINSSGNVTIGSSDLASTNHKLYVSGSSVFAENTFVNRNLYVAYQIASGDLVDWYGVSWSEDSSDPTCTRIGNMALHRSLPILSAMKGYFIGNINSDVPESIIPMNGTWSGTNFSTTGNDAIAVEDLSNGSVMVKIPEFWYIDDYEPSTKTHNLKISQTAKAGWCHHKEAYVGAYEGYNDGVYYRSAKGQIPTVSLSRTTLRSLARANGYEDEYKWNIYTYEEHRAICHLFLVEYATRNSQLAVNTALTSDGFKQGGLGSGCTTGAVIINGVTTYSFIPTGTTDSLGNGSGQVAYTVTLTDADGNETGTVTRYANRYRGIENPFGHIWKYVDDIVNVYNATTTYKTVYKCDKPEHFATNKNAKYKPLCSFPGGTKMQGWSKEIKATINCDFFKYSIGGSESTYWCDYNYDNDDTSEHCLLIGGCSGDGGAAGLFSFYLDNGVGSSYADIGSRLTYLPWAE